MKKKAESFYYKLSLNYHGQNYFGWQVQAGKSKTIQGELNKVLYRICKSKKGVKTVGSGRTDAGVHAISQVVKIEIPLFISTCNLQNALNSLLPKDISVSNAEISHSDFHPTIQAEWKEYCYLFCLDKRKGPFADKYMTYVKYDLDENLMKKACEIFVGEYDFVNFFCKGTEVRSTKRTIFECSLTKERPSGFFAELLPEYYIFKVRGNGFLKQMVRLMVGTLWEIGRKKVSLEELKEALKHKKSRKLAAVAPPQGLYLYRVHYS